MILGSRSRGTQSRAGPGRTCGWRRDVGRSCGMDCGLHGPHDGQRRSNGRTAPDGQLLESVGRASRDCPEPLLRRPPAAAVGAGHPRRPTDGGDHPGAEIAKDRALNNGSRTSRPRDMDQLWAALPRDESRLLLETLVEAGLRRGEGPEAETRRQRNDHMPSGTVTVCHSVVKVLPTSVGGRFAVKLYMKSRRTW